MGQAIAQREEAMLQLIYRDELTGLGNRLAIDLINGSPLLREWVDSPSASPADLDALAQADEAAWLETRSRFLLY